MSNQQLIAEIQERRAGLRDSMESMVEHAKAESRGLSKTEQATFDATEDQIRALDDRINELQENIVQNRNVAAMRAKYAPGNAAAGGADYRPQLPGQAYEPRAVVTREPEVYTRYSERSYFLDLFHANENHDRNASERLARNNCLAADRARAAGEIRAISTTTGAGGEFVPPLWLEQEFVRLARPGRITVDLTSIEPLPSGTDQINIPKVNTGTAVASQSAQNTGINQQDLTSTSISSPVVTIAGGQTVSLQLLEQSPVSVDKLIMADLAADYAVKLNTQVLSGTGAGGTLNGILAMAGSNVITWTQATPALSGKGGLYSILASAIAAIHSARYAAPDAIIMHPRRWAWIIAQADANNRPLVVPTANGSFAAMGVSTEVIAQGSAGTLLGLPVFLDATIPTNLGTSSTEDRIVLVRRDDLLTFEGNAKLEAFQQTYAQNLSVFIRMYNYVAFIATRYPQSVAIISGSGLVTPAF
ncbi:HK97 family phage major capsid protein [Streptacidiphilus sp. MAP12-33]|uniref:phage major capsid protein n=1 Tax=Streptacidiphilus sp. MAP12-33 TaxID=3156266 RepID=UPI0035119685